MVNLLSDNLKATILSAASLTPASDAAVYYVSEDGDDNNSGTETSPWKTISKVNSVLKAGSGKTVICFRRGDTFRGNLTARSNVTFTAYGTGDKPIICGSPENGADPNKWELVSGTENIYKYKTQLRDVGTVFFNDGESYAAKRCPTVNNGEYSFDYTALEDLQFMSVIPATQATGLNNENAATLYSDLYLRCDSGNPGSVYDSIEFSERVYLITLPNGSKNITVDNLCLKYGGAHGIAGSEISDLTVKNCEIAFIGGGIMSYSQSSETGVYTPSRYGNGVEINAACDGYTVENCWIHDIYDAGITHQVGNNHTKTLEFKNITYANNLIEKCTYSIEYFAIPSDDYANGKTADGNVTMKNVCIEGNIMRLAGYGFGEQRTLTDWNVAAHIMGWYSAPNAASDFVIKNNIFDRCVYSEPSSAKKINSSFILVAAEKTDYLPVFSGNTYIHFKGSQFVYYGTLKDNFDSSCFTKLTEDTDVGALLGDSSGTVYALNN